MCRDGSNTCVYSSSGMSMLSPSFLNNIVTVSNIVPLKCNTREYSVDLVLMPREMFSKRNTEKGGERSPSEKEKADGMLKKDSVALPK